MTPPIGRLLAGLVPLVQAELAAQQLVPYRSVTEAILIAADSARPSRYDSLSAVPRAAVAQMTANLAPRVFEAFTSLRERIGDPVSPQSDLDTDELLRAAFDGEEVEQDLSPNRFRNLDIRGIEGYDIELFGFDPLSARGFHIDDEERILGRMIRRLRFGGVLADWGGGAGVFAYEARRLRPDLRVFVNDLHTLTEILNHSQLPPEIDRAGLEAGITRLTGDALSVELPQGKKADLFVSCLLAPYVPDPLRLIAHMYNQVRAGGILVTTVPSKIFDASRRNLSGDFVLSQLLEDLRHQGIEAAAPGKDRTLVVRRPDDRPLEVAATHIRSRLTEFTLQWGPEPKTIQQYLSHYRPAETPARRWLALAGY